MIAIVVLNNYTLGRDAAGKPLGSTNLFEAKIASLE